MTPKEVIEFAKKNKTVMVDLKFMDFPGLWQHFSVPVKELTEDIFENGLGFDGSSIRGWQAIHMSDMLVIPDHAASDNKTYLHDSGPYHEAAVLERPPLCRTESRSVYEINESRRYRIFWSRG
jgi:glutamine synthetase